MTGVEAVKAHCPKCKGSWRGHEAAIRAEDGKIYRGMGASFEAGHVELDGAAENPDSHILTLTWPVKVIC